MELNNENLPTFGFDCGATRITVNFFNDRISVYNESERKAIATFIKDSQVSVSRVTFQNMTEISFMAFSTCFEIWFVVKPGNAYIFSMPTEDSTGQKCSLTHELNDKRTTIRSWQFSVSPLNSGVVSKFISLKDGALLQIVFSATDGKRYGFTVRDNGVQLWDYNENKTVWFITKQGQFSVSQKSETVTGTYGRVLFRKNGPVCYVESTFNVEQQLSTGTWINICDAPSWVDVKYDWLKLMDSSGKTIGIWAIAEGKLKILIHNQSKSFVVKGLLMLNQLLTQRQP